MCHKNGLKWISSALMLEQLKGKIFPYGTSSRPCTRLVYFICRHPRNRDPADKKRRPPLWKESAALVMFLTCRRGRSAPVIGAHRGAHFLYRDGMCERLLLLLSAPVWILLLTQVFLAGASPIIKTGRSAALTESQRSPFHTHLNFLSEFPEVCLGR